MEERQALEAQITRLTGTDAGPPDRRYAVLPMAERLRELQDWSNARTRRASAAVGRDTSRSALLPPPALRATSGEAVPAGRVPLDAETWLAERLAQTQPRQGAELGPENRDSNAAEAAGSRLRPLGGASRERVAAPLERARRRLRPREEAISRARRRIPDDWEARARERIPGIGRADSYVGRRDQRLAVNVGTVEQIGERAEMLRDVREVMEADAERDEARRERALERLKARRQEGGA